MKIRLLKKLTLLTAITLFVGIQLHGQTLKDAIDAYEAGMDLAESDVKAAIASFERSIEIATLLGEEGEEVRVHAEMQIPALHFDMAMAQYRERNIPEAISGFEETIAAAEKYQDDNTKRRSENVLHQLYAIHANTLFRENNNEEALEMFDMALAINPQHARSYLGKGLVYRRMEDVENFKSAMDSALETALMTDEEQIAQTAASTARDFFLVRAVRAKGENNLAQALEFLSSSLTYDESFAETHFLRATIFNEQRNYQDAVNSARRAIELTNGSRDETAKIYFELGKAYEGLGNATQACEAYNNAAFGNYEASARYQMEHVLKCQ
jgi:tetratricopeptide (TPR) repeat protein